MHAFKITKYIIAEYSAVVLAESNHDAGEIAYNMNIGDMTWHERIGKTEIFPCLDWESEALPLAIQTKAGHRMLLNIDDVS